MGEVVIVEGLRTPVGSFGGTLRDFRAQDLGSTVIKALLEKTRLDPHLIDEVIIGNCHYNAYPGIARLSMLRAGLPYEIPAQTVERQCASGLQSIASAIVAIKSGNAEIILAGGTESMSNIPYFIEGARWGLRSGNKTLVDGFFEGVNRVCGDVDQWGNLNMGLTAENIAQKFGISREEQDRFACESHQKGAKAIQEGKFENEIIPVVIAQKKKDPIIFDTDESVRPNTTMEILSKLSPAFKEGGTVTPGNSTTLNDGASCVLMMKEEKAKELGFKPRLRVGPFTSVGVHPGFMGLGPVPAIIKLLKKCGLTLNDIDLFEINEAFAAQCLGVVKNLNFTNKEREKLNVNGGAIALGHALGNSGTRLAITAMNEMERRDVKKGLVSLCVGGGQGMAMIFERKF